MSRAIPLRKLPITRLLPLAILALAACSSPPQKTGTANSPLAREPGFFERLADQVTERECNVFRFTCPYGLGPAGEPCECADGRGYVFRGRTVKK